MTAKCHGTALQLEPKCTGNVISPMDKKKTLPIYTIEGSLPNSSHEAYKKLTRTACNIALIPLMLNSHFTVPLEYQSEDAVFLIDGRDNNKAFCHICEQL